MLQDSKIIEDRYQHFVKKISETEIVFALKDEEGFVTSGSMDYEDEDGESLPLICFWAEKARAKSCIKAEWSNYEVTEIPLVEFLENWCVGMYNDDVIAGTEFDQNMFGYEITPLDLTLDIISELKKLNKDLEFRKFDGISDLEQQVLSILK